MSPAAPAKSDSKCSVFGSKQSRALSDATAFTGFQGFRHQQSFKVSRTVSPPGAVEVGVQEGACVLSGPNTLGLSLRFFCFFPSLVTISHANPQKNTFSLVKQRGWGNIRSRLKAVQCAWMTQSETVL